MGLSESKTKRYGINNKGVVQMAKKKAVRRKKGSGKVVSVIVGFRGPLQGDRFKTCESRRYLVGNLGLDVKVQLGPNDDPVEAIKKARALALDGAGFEEKVTTTVTHELTKKPFAFPVQSAGEPKNGTNF